MADAETYEIRLLSGGDSELMRGLLGCFGEAFGDSDTYCSAQPDDDYLSDLLSSECFFALVAIDDGHVVGGLAGYELRKFEQPRSEFYIYDLAVREPYRRRGIATALVERVKRLARDRGAWTVFVQADLGDDPAIALYSAIGSREDVLHFDISPGEGSAPPRGSAQRAHLANGQGIESSGTASTAADARNDVHDR